MGLPIEDIELFYKLHPVLLLYANQRLNVVPDCKTMMSFMELPIQSKVKIRDALIENKELFDGFVNDNPNNLMTDELGIVLSWKNLIKGKLYIFRHLKNYSIFLDWKDNNSKAYGVYSLNTDFRDMIPNPPVMVHLVLLPFKGKIIFDGMMSYHRIFFGGGIMKNVAHRCQLHGHSG